MILNIDDQKIFIDILGEGHPVILLHGWGQSGGYFDALVKELSKLGNFQFLKIDLPGFGESTPLLASCNLDKYAQTVQKIVQELGLKDYSVIGHSFGGSIAIKAIGRNYIQPKALILCGASGIREPASFKKTLLEKIAKISKPLFRLPILKNFAGLAKKVLYRLSGSADYLDTEGNPILRQTFIQAVSEDLTPLLPQIKIPVLLLWGAKDTYTPLKHAHKMKSLIPRSELIVVSDGTHAVLRQKSSQAAQIVDDFLQK